MKMKTPRCPSGSISIAPAPNLLILLVVTFLAPMVLSACATGATPFDAAHEPKPPPGEPYLNDPLGGYARWGTGDNNGGAISINNDQMTIESRKSQYFVTSALTDQTVHGDYNYGMSPWLEHGDVDLTFDATVEQDAGSFALSGAACRYENGGTFYAFIIQSDGKYTIRRFVNENVTKLVEVTPSNAIHTGLATNQVHIVCMGNQLELWVNGTQLASLTDDQLKTGSIAMAGGAGDKPGTRVSFQNLIVSAPYPNGAAYAQAMATKTENAIATAAAAPTKMAMETVTVQAEPTVMARETAAANTNATETAKAAPCLSNATPMTNPNFPNLSAVPPAIANWHVLLSDSFDQASNGWTIQTAPFSAAFAKVAESIVNKHYCWDLVSKTDHAFNRGLPDIKTVTDVAVSVDGLQVSGTPNSAYGVAFRGDTYNFYFFEIADDQTYRFGRGAVEIADSFWGSGKSSAIRSGQVNRVTVIAQGSHLTYFVNGQPIAEHDDEELKSGPVGLAAELFQPGDHAVFEFGNFEVRVP
jgi:3-keto-disaccharide hydrolase